jgi:hypothetical protein
VLKIDGVKMTPWLRSGWDSSLLKYDGEVFFLTNCRLYDFLLRGDGEVPFERRNIKLCTTISYIFIL